MAVPIESRENCWLFCMKMFVSKCSRSLQILPIMLSTHLKTTPPCAGRAVEGRSLLYRLRSLWRQNHQDQSPYQNDSALKHNLSRNAISWRIMFYNWMCGVSEGIKSERLSPVTIMDAHRKKISSSLGCHETISWGSLLEWPAQFGPVCFEI